MQKYDVICASSLESLVKSVNIVLKRGWKTTGGVTISEGYSGKTYIQAVVKEEE